MKFVQVARRILSFCHGDGSVVEKIAREHNCIEKLSSLEPELKVLLDSCLSISSARRPSGEEISRNAFFHKYQNVIQFKLKPKSVVDLTPLERFERIDQVYYLWQLAGGDVQSELKKEGLTRCEPPVLTIPRLVMLHQAKAHPTHKCQSVLFDQRILVLSTSNLEER